MKLLVQLLIASSFLLSGCIKDDKGCSNISPSSEDAQMLAYASANGITPLKHSSGMYYQVITPGTGAAPTINSTVTVNYTGKFLDNTQFDKSPSPVSFQLSQVIEGWIMGIPLISKGGRIKLIIPSSMAYGCNGARTIPSNSVLFFDVELLDIK